MPGCVGCTKRDWEQTYDLTEPGAGIATRPAIVGETDIPGDLSFILQAARRRTSLFPIAIELGVDDLAHLLEIARTQ